MKKVVFRLVCVVVLGLAGFFCYCQWFGASPFESMDFWPVAQQTTRKVIVIDPGHGFEDSGKEGVNNVLEKDLNLAIAFKLKDCLSASGFKVYMTRSDDKTLYDGFVAGSKREDLQRRVQLMTDTQAAAVVSIHQNSFTQEKYKGAQCFYYAGSLEGERLAAAIQAQLIAQVDSQNTRQPKSNGEYYILKNAPENSPIVLVECGFLSNYEEAKKLAGEEYQQQIAQAICDGVKDYFGE